MKNNLKILLVENNHLNQRLIRFILKMYNHEVDTANNGVEAIEKFRNFKYDLILMDVMMPVMDGIEATLKIRNIENTGNIEKRTSIVAINANALNDERDLCLLAGMDEIINKPFDIEKLESIINFKI